MIPGWQMEAYERLRTEVVRSVVLDLEKAVKKSNKQGSMCDEQKYLEKWLLSKWGQFLSGDNGEFIIERCRKTQKARKVSCLRRSYKLVNQECVGKMFL